MVTKEQIEFYREYGFVQIDNVLTSDELSELRIYLEEVMTQTNGHGIHTDKEGGSYYKVLNQKVDVWRDHAGMAKYSLSENFAQMAQLLTGVPSIRLYHDHALYKMPGDSKETPWHQDFPFWPMKESGALSMWLALDDVNENNGCMVFMPRSHKLGKVASIDFLEPIDIFELSKGTHIDDEKPVIVRMKAGSCTFHDGLTFHFAHANRTSNPRRVLAVIYMPDGTKFDGKSTHVTDSYGLQIGDSICGPRNPVLAKLSVKSVF
nr:phytanoyl-CoA dioxygenase family protein [Cohnella sp. WQ 127256]